MSSLSSFLEQSLSELDQDQYAYSHSTQTKAAAPSSQKTLRRVNARLAQLGVEPAHAATPSALLATMANLLRYAEEQVADDRAERRGEAEKRALVGDKKQLKSELENVKRQLAMERQARQQRTSNEASGLRQAVAERDELRRQVALASGKAAAMEREMKRRDTENERLRDKLKKYLDGSATLLDDDERAPPTIVGDARHTPMKATRVLDAQALALKRQLADIEAENWKLKGEKHQMKQMIASFKN